MDTPSTNNVIAFGRPQQATPQPPLPEGGRSVTAAPSEEEDSVRRFAEFLLENAANVDFFVASIGMKFDPTAPEGRATMHTVTSPIAPGSYALAIKKLEHSFYQQLDTYGV